MKMAKPLLILSLVYTLSFIYPVYFYPAPHLVIEICRWVNHGIWALFGIDYLVMFFLAQNKRHFLRAHIFELILVALPFARMLRPLRAILFIGQAGFKSRSQLIKNIWGGVTVATALMVLILSAAILDVERTLPNSNIKSPGDAIWWGLVTVTTIGYGDRFPISTEGRFIAGVLIIFGVIMMATVTGALAAWILEQQVEEDL